MGMFKMFKFLKNIFKEFGEYCEYGKYNCAGTYDLVSESWDVTCKIDYKRPIKECNAFCGVPIVHCPRIKLMSEIMEKCDCYDYYNKVIKLCDCYDDYNKVIKLRAYYFYLERKNDNCDLQNWIDAEFELTQYFIAIQL